MADSEQDSIIDDLIRDAPDSIFDCRSYYWPNFKSPLYVRHSFQKFTYSFTLPTISRPGSYYVATFEEPLLLTWVGVKATIEHRIAASTSINISCVEGEDPFTNARTNVFQYCNVPPPVGRHEPNHVHYFMKKDNVDSGLPVHYRVREQYSVEMEVRIDGHSCIHNPVVVLKVQTPRLVGGFNDRPLWDKHEYLRLNGDKTRKHFPDYLQYKSWMKSAQGQH